MIPVHTLWIRGPLNPLAVISINAYRKHGCVPIVWAYEPVSYAGGIDIRDAREILPESMIDEYTFVPTGQLALFSDRFAWEVLHKFGGWFGHLDLTLLRPLRDFDTFSYAFGTHHRYMAHTALWKAPKASAFTERARRIPVQRPPTDWHEMMRAHSQALLDCRLEHYVTSALTTDDSDLDILSRLTRAGASVPMKWESKYAIHWCGSGPLRDVEIEEGSYLDDIRRAVLP